MFCCTPCTETPPALAPTSLGAPTLDCITHEDTGGGADLPECKDEAGAAPAPGQGGAAREACPQTGRDTSPTSSLQTSILPCSDTEAGLPQPAAATTQEELSEQGVPARQASHVRVRQNEQALVHQLFQSWIRCFFCILCIMTPLILAVVVWVFVEYVRYRDVECDVPLQTWFLTHLVVSLVYNTGVAKRIARCCCGYPDPEGQRPMPLLLRVYNSTHCAFTFTWNCLGLHWVASDGSGGEFPPCEDATPGLYTSMKVYTILNIFSIVIPFVFLFGPCALIFAIRRGLLRSTQAAPKGTVDKVTTIVAADDPEVAELVECSICMEKYGESGKPIARTQCGHVFHKACLKNWIESIKGTCPLCREELAPSSR